MTNNFLAVDKEYFNKGLQALDILILSQVAEYKRNKCDCYLTNEQFSEMFGATLYAVKTSLDRLENMKYIKRKDSYITGNGRANRQRVIKMVGCPSTNQAHNGRLKSDNGRLKNDDGRLKFEEWSVDSRPIKEKEKENKKKNSASDEAHSANAVSDKWVPEDEVSNKIFGSPLHSDIKMMEFIQQEYNESKMYGYNRTLKEIANEMCFSGSDTDKIIAYIEEVLV